MPTGALPELKALAGDGQELSGFTVLFSSSLLIGSNSASATFSAEKLGIIYLRTR